jgi:hypothetical protein
LTGIFQEYLMFSRRPPDGDISRYYLASRWPRIWRTRALASAGVSFAFCCAAFVLLFVQTSELRPDAIPDFHFWFVILLFASTLTTAIWLSAVSKHFEVGSSGYRTRSPTLPLLVVVIAMFWVPTFLYAYEANKALASMASEEAAGRGYLYMERVASFFGAAAHYERFKMEPDIPPIEPPDSFSTALIRGEALRADASEPD